MENIVETCPRIYRIKKSFWRRRNQIQFLNFVLTTISYTHFQYENILIQSRLIFWNY